MSLPSFSALTALDRVDRTGSVRAAAESLSLTPSAVTHKLRALEAALGFAVVAPRGRGVATTTRARRYLAAARPALAQLTAATEAASNEGGGALFIGAAPGFATSWLCPRLADFRAAHPGVALSLQVAGADGGDQADVTILFQRPDEAAAGDVHLLTPAFFPVASPALAHGQRPLRALADLADAPLLHLYDVVDWALWLRGGGEHQLADAVAQRAGDVTFRDANMMFAAAEAGLGVALGDAITCSDAITRGALTRLFPVETISERAYYIRAGAAPTRASRAFVRWVREALALN